MKLLFAIVGLIVLGLLGIASPVAACTCIAPQTPTQELIASDAVFLGRVVAQEKGFADVTPVAVTFFVEHWWKGGSTELVRVTTAGNSAACGFLFEDGEQYVVYASGDPLETGLCTRTKAIANAGEDLKELGEGFPPAPSASSSPLDLNLIFVLLGVAVIAGIALGVLGKKGIIKLPKPRSRKQ